MGAEEGARLLKAAKLDGFPAFSKFLTWLERTPAREAFVLKELQATRTLRIGITGPPGAGKSTLTGQLIRAFRALNLKVGVMAVDPSSPFSRGAILGDRIRYTEHFLDPGVFIRSLGTRGSLGGLSSAAYVMARAFDALEFDVLLIETVGVGQTELDVLHVADHVAVVLVPESGDSVQAMKAGLMEIADTFIVNKSDRPGAAGLVREIEAAMGDGGVSSPVFSCVATAGDGVDEVAKHFAGLRARADWSARRLDPKRLREEAKALLRREWEQEMDAELKRVVDWETFLARVSSP